MKRLIVAVFAVAFVVGCGSAEEQRDVSALACSECRTDADCRAGSKCAAAQTLRCFPAGVSPLEAPCVPGYACPEAAVAACRPACQTDADCGGGRCADGICQQCASDSDCAAAYGAGARCYPHATAQTCGTDSECSAAQPFCR